ncbi:MAG: RNA-directed DNA polymerase [Candidatus Sumerlaeota bacterium]|nr:RNA-directed DNA polymerase [Candidatus Sumerlaeota bacterium]
MKRHGDLWPEVVSFRNLCLAARKAQRGKRWRENVLEFNYCQEALLLEIQEELLSKTYCPGPYRSFVIVEPKRRLISAAPYRDRIVHHALCNVIEPIFDRTFIMDSYATRLNKGTHKALERFTGWARSSRWILQCDIRKYFPSIDHEILKGLIRRKIKCLDTLWLADSIIEHSNPQEPVEQWFDGDDLLTPASRRKGLPIGNLTSQFFANVYLNSLDHFVKETLGAGRYLRYMDDFALFSDNREELAAAREKIEAYLAGLRLRIHPVKSQLFKCREGVNFLGFRILQRQIRVRSENLKRARRRLKIQQALFAQGDLEFAKVKQSVQSWIAHLRHGTTARLRQRIFKSLVFRRA